MRHARTLGMLGATLAGLVFGGVGEAQELEGFFGVPEVIDVDVGGSVCCQATSADELTLYFSRWIDNPRNNPDIYFMTRERRDEPFVGPARQLDGLNSVHEDWVGAGSLSADGQEIYFSSTRQGGLQDIWVARFDEPGKPEGGFHNIERLDDEVNTPGWEASPNISRDGLRLYFRSDGQAYVAARDNKGDPFSH